MDRRNSLVIILVAGALCRYHIIIIEGNLGLKFPTIWTHEKQSQEETRTWRKSEGRRSEMEKVRREKMHVREKVGFKVFTVPRRAPPEMGRGGGAPFVVSMGPLQTTQTHTLSRV